MINLLVASEELSTYASTEMNATMHDITESLLAMSRRTTIYVNTKVVTEAFFIYHVSDFTR